MKDKKKTSEITNIDTGETHDIILPHFFSRNCELNTLVKILRVETSFHPLDNSRQIIVDCLALDSGGFAFKLTMDFMPNCIDYEQRIISDLTEGKILAVSGLYQIMPEDEGGIFLFNPTYISLPPEYSLEEVEEVFRVNKRYNKHRSI